MPTAGSTLDNPTNGDWRTSTLGECAIINPDAYSPKEAWPFINYLDTGSVTENLVSDIQRLTPGEDKIPARARRKVKRGDIVYSTVRPNQKHYGIIKDIPDNFLASTGFAVIRAKQDIADTGFIYYFLTQTHIVEHLHTIAEESMTAYPAIRPSDIERLEIHLPPRPTQRAIARILGAFDDKIALNAGMNATLEAMAQALFRAWFIDFEPVRAKRSGRWRPGQTLPGMPAALYDLFPAELTPTELGDVPVGWELRTIGDLAHVSSGKRPPKRYRTPSDEASVPVYGGNGVMAYVAEPLIDYPILMTGRAGTLGSVFRITEPCWLSDNTLIVKPIDGKSFDFLLFSLERVDYRNLNRGSTQPLLAQSDLKAQLIVVPPTAILEYFQGCSSSMYNKHDAITAESRTLADMRDTLLPKLMSGEVPVE